MNFKLLISGPSEYGGARASRWPQRKDWKDFGTTKSATRWGSSSWNGQRPQLAQFTTVSTESVNFDSQSPVF